ncbi:hypothetical protein KY284_011031 [Solanum tuberosum]|nr:hypothetical protein KY284_011031 [Solanum tuberosum]
MAAGQLSTEAGQLSMSDFSHLNPNMPIINPSLPIGKSYINSITNGTPTSESIALKEVLYVEGFGGFGRKFFYIGYDGYYK